jgi:hypothetical protein
MKRYSFALLLHQLIFLFLFLAPYCAEPVLQELLTESNNSTAK